MDQKLMNCHSAARYLDMSESALRMRLHKGQIPGDIVKRIGRRVYLDRVALDAHLKNKGKIARSQEGADEITPVQLI